MLRDWGTGPPAFMLGFLLGMSVNSCGISSPHCVLPTVAFFLFFFIFFFLGPLLPWFLGLWWLGTHVINLWWFVVYGFGLGEAGKACGFRVAWYVGLL